MAKEFLTGQQIVDEIKINGNGSLGQNKRGDNKYITNIIYNPYYNLPKVNSMAGLEEIQHGIGIRPDYIKNKIGGLNDDELGNEYCKLYSEYPNVLQRLSRGSRNTVLVNDKTCVSMLGFTKTGNIISLLVFQRSADVSLGLRYDYLQANGLLDHTVEILGGIRGQLVYQIGNAHIYLNNMNKTDKNKYYKN